MMDLKKSRFVFLGTCILIGILASFATDSIITGIMVALLIFIAWKMWEYIRDISR